MNTGRTPMLIAALYKIAKIRKQLKCPSMEKWIKKILHTHTHILEYYSAMRKRKF